MRRLKTSDRLLAAMVIGSVVLVCCIQLALYAQFRRGHIVTWKQLQQRRFVQFHPRKPAVVSLTGTVWVNIFPSDSFYVELPKTQSPVEKPWMTGQTGPEESIPMPGFTETADTLLVTGGFAATLHRPYVDLSYRNHIPVVNIYGSGFDEIRLLNGQLVLNGSPT
ncbi:MAG TPA: hypothetical protein VHE54_19905, partial [Puia sp.]|nr:hypothetical protein [Puia sp.]